MTGDHTRAAVLTTDEIVARVLDERHRPLLVGISGFGGSGKSTLARTLAERVPGGLRLRGDDFLDPVRSHHPSDDWDGVDRQRIADEVLVPFRVARPTRFRRYDWEQRTLGGYEPLPAADVLIVDLVGLFHPDTLPLLDVTIWVDVDLADATERGIARDRAHGSDHDDLWRDVWVPNERAFLQAFRPDRSAAVHWRNPRHPDLPVAD